MPYFMSCAYAEYRNWSLGTHNTYFCSLRILYINYKVINSNKKYSIKNATKCHLKNFFSYFSSMIEREELVVDNYLQVGFNRVSGSIKLL